MKRRGHITSFYIETLLLVLVFVAVLMVITQVFGLGKAESRRAGELTSAVTLAQNAAEAVSVSKNTSDLAAILDENDNVTFTDTIVEARYTSDMQPSPDGGMTVSIEWEPETLDAGTFISCRITVRTDRSDETIYTLDTGVYVKEGA